MCVILPCPEVWQSLSLDEILCTFNRINHAEGNGQAYKCEFRNSGDTVVLWLR
jgi:hypothetical protein